MLTPVRAVVVGALAIGLPTPRLSLAVESIFADGFDDGGFCAWSSTIATGAVAAPATGFSGWLDREPARVGAAECSAATHPGGARFATSPTTGHCYVAFDDVFLSHPDATAFCAARLGYLVVVTSVAEQAIVATLRDDAQHQWIGASDVAVEGEFRWITCEPFVYADWIVGEPDDDSGAGGGGDCVAVGADSPDARWRDTACNFVGFVSGLVCEFP